MTTERLKEIANMFNASGLGLNVIIGVMLAHMETTNTLEEFLKKFPQFVESEKRRN